jgi:hypothetical protein
MPDGDGLMVVKELRASNPNLPIVLIIAQGSVELAVRAVEEGATDFIAKPFAFAAIADLLRRYLQAQQEFKVDAGSDCGFTHRGHLTLSAGWPKPCDGGRLQADRSGRPHASSHPYCWRIGYRQRVGGSRDSRL